MTPRRILGTILACSLVILLIVGLRDLRREIAGLRESAAALDQRAAALAAATSVPPPPSPSPEPAAAPAAVVKTAPPAGALARFSDTNALGDPDHAAVIARRQRRYAFANNRHAIDALRLSPVDAAALKELLAAQWLARADTADVLDRMRDATPELRAQARAALQAEAEQKVKDLLGPEGYAAFQSAYQASTTRQMNWALFTDFWDAGVPVTADQKTALAQAMARIRAAAPPGVDATAPDPQTGLKPADLQLLEAAATILAPDQLSFLRERKLAEARYAEVVRAAGPRRAAPPAGAP